MYINNFFYFKYNYYFQNIKKIFYKKNIIQKTLKNYLKYSIKHYKNQLISIY